MRHAEVRVSAKEDSSMDHGRRRKEIVSTSHAAAPMATGSNPFSPHQAR